VNPSSQILLRGVRSIGQSNEALVVIDGAISSIGAFDDLNPQDIESMDILKGATAAALYGSRAGNGVLLVTTKKGQKGENITVGINTAVTFENVAYLPDFQNKFGIGWEGAYDPIENTNWGPRFDGTLRQIGPTFADGTFQEVPFAPVKDNLLAFFNQGSTVQNTFYLSGGNETGSMYLSVGNQETKGILPNDTYKRTTVRANATKKMGDVEITLNSSFFRDDTNEVGNFLGAQNRTLYWFILNTPANIPLENYKDWRNDLFSSPDGYFNGYYQNPYYMADTSRDLDNTNRLVGNISVSWDTFDWLNLTARLGGNFVTGEGLEWRDAQVFTDAYTRPTGNTSFVRDSNFQRTDYTVDFLAAANFDLSEDFTLKTIVGSNTTNTVFSSGLVIANNLAVPGLYDISNAGSAADVTVTANDFEERTYGVFADITLGFNDFLFLNASGRYDFTSTLFLDDNSYFYPAIGLSAVLTDAIPAIKSDVFNYAKVTVSNSTVYNDLDAEDIVESFGRPTGFPFSGASGFEQPGQFVDSGITKEKINTTEVGLNLGLFNNRVSLDAAYFKTFITDNIVPQTTPPSSAGTGSLTNIGEIESTGFEATLGATILKSNDFSWDVNVNFTTNKAVVNEIGDPTVDNEEIALATTGEFGVFAIEGEQWPTLKASAYYRDPQGRVVIDPADGDPISTTELDGDNPQAGLKNLGSTVPDYIIGLNSSINYKSFRLAATFDYRTGHVYYAQGSDAMEFTARSVESASANRQDFVFPNSSIETSPGVFVENTNIPISQGRQGFWNNVYNEIKENYVRDATAVKLREIALSYTMPAKVIENLPVKKVTVGLIGRNLLTWLPAENRFSDPEFSNNNAGGNGIGIGGYFQSPPTSSVGFNINVEF